MKLFSTEFVIFCAVNQLYKLTSLKFEKVVK